jgi:hypothetical protein
MDKVISVLAVLAMVCFILALFGVESIFTLDAVVFGLAFVAAHLAFGLPLNPQNWRR